MGEEAESRALEEVLPFGKFELVLLGFYIEEKLLNFGF